MREYTYNTEEIKEGENKQFSKEKYLKLLSKEFKNTTEVAEEIINLKSILNLPKGTEMS